MPAGSGTAGVVALPPPPPLPISWQELADLHNAVTSAFYADGWRAMVSTTTERPGQVAVISVSAARRGVVPGVSVWVRVERKRLQDPYGIASEILQGARVQVETWYETHAMPSYWLPAHI